MKTNQTLMPESWAISDEVKQTNFLNYIIQFVHRRLGILLITLLLPLALVAQNPFITSWQTTTANESITIPTTGSGYNYSVDWGDGSPVTTETSNATHSYTSAGDYEVRISGDFPRIYFNNSGDKQKILSIEQWGEISWSSMSRAFWGCTNLVENATDAPDLSNVTDLSSMFRDTGSFNQDIGNWDVSTITNMDSVFRNADAFNQNINNWDVSNVNNMIALFESADSYNQDLSTWNVDNVTNMAFVFANATVFDQDIGSWNVGNVMTMLGMFANAPAFNQDIGNWNVGNVINMVQMFSRATSFNQDIGNWDVSNVTNMSAMFEFASNFNQDIGNWSVGNVTQMSGMFIVANNFDQDLGNWDVSNVITMNGMFNGVTLSTLNYDSLLIGWNAQNLKPNVPFSGGNSEYCSGASARNNMINSDGWTITDGGEDPNCPKPFITIWQTTVANETITIPTTGSGYNYSVDWGDGTTSNEVGNATHTYVNTGIHSVSITGDFPRIYFSNGGDKLKIRSIEQWGNIEWTSMYNAFFGCSNLEVNAMDTPDLSQVLSIQSMFWRCTSMAGNNSFGNWDVSNITNMRNVFAETRFNQPIGNWDVSNVTDLSRTLANQYFNQDISSWDVGNAVILSFLFSESPFNQDISSWDLSSADDLTGMFLRSSFDGDISSWHVSSVRDMSQLFSDCPFNQDISNWDVSAVTDMKNMFEDNSSFNQDIGNWDVGSVGNMASMFANTVSFQQNINGWDVSSVEIMDSMFKGSSFNQDIGAWNLSLVRQMDGMFQGSIFNQDISNWNVSTVRDMDNMFTGAIAFNQDIGSWDVSTVLFMRNMFAGATSFNQDIGNWDVSNVVRMNDMFDNVTLSTENYDALLIGWNVQNLKPNISFSGGNSQYCDGVAARDNMINSDSWTITDGGLNCPIDFTNAFVTTWQTTAGNESITIPTTGSGYNYTVDWGDMSGVTTHTGNATHNYTNAGTYEVKLSGAFPRIYFNNSGDKNKILTVEQWGDIAWTSMESAFLVCQNLDITAQDTPDLQNVTTIERIFEGCRNLVGNNSFNDWDTSTVTNMSVAFSGARNFNQPLNNWNVSSVTDMSSMFYNALSFNQPLDSWDVSSVEYMRRIFSNARTFNQPLNSWDVSSVVIMSEMFSDAIVFNQPLNNWNLSSAIDLGGMFRRATAFNQPLGAWDTSSFVGINSMFSGATSFNQPLNSWNVSSVRNMGSMFRDATTFNQPLDSWNTSEVTVIAGMFRNATAFNQPLNSWDVSKVTEMSQTFDGAVSFNQPLDTWHTALVRRMIAMFRSANNFDQNIGNWDISSVFNMSDLFANAGLSIANYDALLIGWGTLDPGETQIPNGITLDAGSSLYCEGNDKRQELISNFGWTINDSGKNCPDADGDGINDDVDNCPDTANADQADNDNDGDGDVCDEDDDNDGIPDTEDPCPFVADTEAPVLTCPQDLIVSTDPGQCDALVDFQFAFEDNSSLFVGIDFQSDPFTIIERATTVSLFATDAELQGVLPQEIAFDQKGDIYVSIESSGSKIVKFDGDTGAYLGDFLAPGTQLSGGNGLAFGPDGNLYVADGNVAGGFLYKVDGTTGTLLQTFTLNTSYFDFTFSPDGMIYIPINGSILKLDPNTGTTSTFATDTNLDGFSFAATFGQDGDLFVSGLFSNDVLRFNGVTGASEGTYLTANGFVRDLIFGPQGFFYAVTNNKVQIYDAATGNFLSNYVDNPALQATASAAAFGPDGLMYVLYQDPSAGIYQVVPDRGIGTFPIGTTEVTINGTDDCGNSSSCTFSITVENGEEPIALCQDIAIQLDEFGNAQVTADQLDAGSSSTCANVQAYINGANRIGQGFSNTNFNNFGHGQSFTATETGVLTEVKFYVNGNSSGRNIHFYNNGTGSGTAFDIGTPDYTESGVDLVDSAGGTIWTEVLLSKPLSVVAGQQYSFVIEGNTDIYYSGFNAYSGGDFIFAYDLSSGCCEFGDIAFDLTFATNSIDYSCASVGDNDVTLLVVDDFGNSATCTATVTVEDIAVPVVACIEDITVDANTANCSAVVDLEGLNASDICGVVSASLSSNGETIFDYVFVEGGSGGLASPRPMVFGPDGNLYVSNLINNIDDSVLRFDGTTGEFIDSFTATGLLQYPRGLDFGPDGNLYVASNRTDEVLKFDGATGALLSTFVPSGANLSRPTGLTFGPDGDLFVASAGTSEVQRYDGVTGAFEGVVASGLSFPIGIEFGADNNLYIANGATNAVLRFDGTTGNYIDDFIASGLGGLAFPEDIEFGPDGNLYVTSFSSSQVLAYDGTTGAFLRDVSASGVSIGFPDGLTFGPDGHLYVSDNSGDRIVRYPTALEFPLGTTEVTYEVADASGNSASCSFHVTVEGGELQDVLPYTIIAEEEVHLHGNNTVMAGNVAVLDDDGDAKIHDETVVAGDVIAADIDLDDDSSVGGQNMAPAVIDLPQFYYNTFSDGDSEDITVEEDETVVLDGDVYGKVEVKEGGTVIFTNPNVFLEELKTKEFGNVEFTGNTNLIVEKKVDFYKNTTFNSGGHTVVIYAEDDVTVDEGSTVNANIFTLKELEVKGKDDYPTTMSGLFIGNKVKGNDYVTWEPGTSCVPAEFVEPEVVADCECKGGMVSVTFEYAGDGSSLTTNSGIITDNGDGTYTVTDGGNKLDGNLEISDGSNIAEIHTSCSDDILGVTFAGDITVTAYMDNYGNIGSVEGCLPAPEPCECNGGMVSVTFSYDGTGELSTNSGNLFDNGNGTYTVTADADEKLEKDLEITDGTDTAEIHTSCSDDILGVTFAGGVTVIAHTDNYGNVCSVPSDDDGGVKRGESGPVAEDEEAIATSVDIDDSSLVEFDVKAWPVPSKSHFNLKIMTMNTTDKVEISVVDISNKLIHVDSITSNQSYQFGEKLSAGVYFVRIVQGANIKIIRVMKR